MGREKRASRQRRRARSFTSEGNPPIWSRKQLKGERAGRIGVKSGGERGS
ncbi:unnamed protein product [Spirodela intermedia]|uniref:Uncharacterized protein n=2 Tax=Spirodela intermedia TaxID=51605 RepID=A0A7I8LBP6_SPIIN|nr:unnamed protein product [Spirodela intermedia]CAA6670383.1 unnamed protein product [Spirodela intermedia]CAA7407443.1 unnamed protein product [Spirodela intermedia]